MRLNRPSIGAALGLLAVILAFRSSLSAQDAPSLPLSEEDELYYLLFGEAPLAEFPEDMLLVAGISIECPPSLEESFVLSFSEGIRVGGEMRARELDVLIKKAQERMSLSNMFYSSSASYERLETDAGEDGLIAVRVLIRASEGFWWGFGFSPWDLSIAYRNLGGAGKDLGATLGLNSQALSYLDMSISNGPFYLAAEAGHGVTRRESRIDPSYLYEELKLSSEMGIKIGDDVKLGVALGYLAFRSPDEYFLYPGYEPPSASDLALLGLSGRVSSLIGAGLRVSIGSYSFLKRGGVKAMSQLGLDALSSSFGGWEIAPRAAGLFQLRLDAPALLRLSLRERITYLPRTADAGIPQALWASAGEMRRSSALPAGELASLSRVSLDLDRVAAISLGFAELGIVPELFYELGSVKRSDYGGEARFQQDIGFLLKIVASMPIGRTFAFGVALGLEGESDSRIDFVFEVQ